MDECGTKLPVLKYIINPYHILFNTWNSHLAFMLEFMINPYHILLTLGIDIPYSKAIPFHLLTFPIKAIIFLIGIDISRTKHTLITIGDFNPNLIC